MSRILAFLSLSSLALVSIHITASRAFACDNVVNAVTGPGDKALERSLGQVLRSKRCTLISAKKAATAAGGDLQDDRGRKQAAAELEISAIVVTTIKKRGARWEAESTVYEGASGSEIRQNTWRSKKRPALFRLVAKQFWSKLGGKINSASAGETPALEIDTSKTIAVAPFDGPGSSQASSATVEALEKAGYRVIGPEEVQQTVDSKQLDLQQQKDIQTLSEELEADAIITGSVQRSRGRYNAEISVHSGNNGSTLQTETWQGRRANRLGIQNNFVTKMVDGLEQSQKAQKASVSIAASTNDDDQEPQEAEDEPSDLYALDIWVGGRSFTRDLSYTDDTLEFSVSPQPYSIVFPPGFAFMAGADWFPATHFTNGLATYFGLRIAFEHSIGLLSQTESQSVANQTVEVPTVMYQFKIGGLFRYPLGDLQLLTGLGYGIHAFKLNDISVDEPKPQNFPNVEMQYLNLHGGARYDIGDLLFVSGNLGYRLTFAAGEIGTFFPHANAGGIDADLGLGIHIYEGLEGRLGLEWQRYFYSVNPEPGDQYIVGGALDESFSLTYKLAYRL